MDQPVQFWRAGRAGRIRLNRPKALNALDLDMVRLIHGAISEFGHDPTIHAILIDAPERGFCAGGDVRALRAGALAGDPSFAKAFFTAEYAMNQAIKGLRKPYIALIDGVCMGGGIGISVHGSHRIATEKAMFAMPETAIALFPDVGTSYALPRLPGYLGMYIGLTGARMLGADAVHAGFATHFCASAKIPELAAAIEQNGAAVIAAFAEPLPSFSIAAQRATTDACFSAPSVPEIFARLEDNGTEFALATLATLRAHSPSALFWSHRIIAEGAHRTLPQALEAELALVMQVAMHPEFIEGVRAVLVDKDKSPKWQPARVEDVQISAINALFA